MEEDNNILYALYEGDEWLSNDSLVCMGLFDIEHLDGACERLIRERGELFKEHLIENGYDGESLLRYCKDNCIDRKKGESRDDLYNRLCDEFVDELKEKLLNEMQTQGYSVNFYIKSITVNEYGEL